MHIDRGLFLTGIISALLSLRMEVVIGSTVRVSHDVPCYQDEDFVRALWEESSVSGLASVHDKMLEVIYGARFLSEDPLVCTRLGAFMRSIKDDYLAIRHAPRSATSLRLISAGDSPTPEQFSARLAGYLVALSGHPRGPFLASRKGLGKIRTMSVVDYAVLGDSRHMTTLLSEREQSLVNTMLAFYGRILEEASSSSTQKGTGSRLSPPPTPSFEGRASDPHSPEPTPRYLPGHDEWYDLLFGVVSNLLTWGDEELVNLYESVLQLLMTEGILSPNCRSSIYHSLMYVNRQLYLDRGIGLPTIDASDVVPRIKTYKRILMRFVNLEDQFVLSFEQIEMVDLYEEFTKSLKFASSRNFAYKDRIERDMLNFGILFSLEFDAPNNLLSNIVGSVFRRIVDKFPTEDERLNILLFEVAKIIRGMRENPKWNMEAVEDDMLRLYGRAAWITPVDLGTKYLSNEYCLGFSDRESQNNCEQMIALLDKQMIGHHEWIGRSHIVTLEKQNIIIPLLRLNKVILDRVVKGVRGTEVYLTTLESLLAGIESKLAYQRPIDLSHERELIDTLLKSMSPPESDSSASSSESSSSNVPTSRKERRKAKRPPSRGGR